MSFAVINQQRVCNASASLDVWRTKVCKRIILILKWHKLNPAHILRDLTVNGNIVNANSPVLC